MQRVNLTLVSIIPNPITPHREVPDEFISRTIVLLLARNLTSANRDIWRISEFNLIGEFRKSTPSDTDKQLFQLFHRSCLAASSSEIIHKTNFPAICRGRWNKFAEDTGHVKTSARTSILSVFSAPPIFFFFSSFRPKLDRCRRHIVVRLGTPVVVERSLSIPRSIEISRAIRSSRAINLKIRVFSRRRVWLKIIGYYARGITNKEKTS